MEGKVLKTKDVYLKTLKFVWLKLALGAVTILFALITLAIFLAIGSIGDGGGMYIAFLLWIVVVCGGYSALNHYIGYIIKAGHVAMVAKAVTEGELPDDQFGAAKEMVKERFATSNVYFVVNSLVGGAVNQLQKTVGKVGSFLDAIPGMSFLTSFAQTFIHIALNYIDECCLGYTFLHKDESAFKSAADGIVIYFQNWKKLLKDAAVTALAVMVISVLAWVLPFIIFGSIFKALGVSWVFAFIIAIMFAAVVRSAFVDSYMMVKMMVSYMEVTPSTEITFDLYGKLCKLSAKFKKLFENGQKEENAA